MGVNFTLAPMPVLDTQFSLSMQGVLADENISPSRVNQSERELTIVREGASPLNIKVGLQGPVGQLLITSPFPERSVEVFAREAASVVMAFEMASATPPRQTISKDATIRELYDAEGIHAFQEIWEEFLQQDSSRLDMLGKEVLGGGLRFVMPPRPDEVDPVQMELKIESFLRDSSKIYLEAQFAWPQPSQPGVQLNPEALLVTVDTYLQQIASSFAGE